MKGKTSVVDSPILPDYFKYGQPNIAYNFDVDAAKALLEKSGFKDDGSGLRSKPNSKTLAFQFKKYLKIGSKGTDVVQLQGCLAKMSDNFKNLLQSETNGTFGKGTENAVTEFQKKYLPDSNPTGELGPSTRKKLNELCFVSQDNSILLKFNLTSHIQLF